MVYNAFETDVRYDKNHSKDTVTDSSHRHQSHEAPPSNHKGEGTVLTQKQLKKLRGIIQVSEEVEKGLVEPLESPNCQNMTASISFDEVDEVEVSVNKRDNSDVDNEDDISMQDLEALLDECAYNEREHAENDAREGSISMEDSEDGEEDLWAIDKDHDDEKDKGNEGNYQQQPQHLQPHP